MSPAVAPSAGGGFHFTIPEGTARSGEGHDSWGEWGVDKEEVTSVAIPTSMTSIGWSAFNGCISCSHLVHIIHDNNLYTRVLYTLYNDGV